MSIKYTDLTFPQGEFSHTSLAAFNGFLGDGRKKIWTAYQTAIAEKIIESTGTTLKSGKGKAAALWVVTADGKTKVKMSPDSVPAPAIVVPSVVPVVADLVPAKPGRKPKTKKTDKTVDTTVVLPPTTVPAENVSENVIPPAAAPVVVAVVPVVEPVKPPTTVDDLKPVTTTAAPVEMLPTDLTCPICKTPLVQYAGGKGIFVKCPQMDKKICPTNENPYGFGKSTRAAYEILCQKFCREHNEAEPAKA